MNRETTHPETIDEKSYEKKVEELFSYFKELPVISRGFDFIDKGLAAKYPELAKRFPGEVLPYHGKHHSEDVLKEAILFALIEGVSEHDLELLAVAATYHDTGFVEQYDANEEKGAATAEKFMREEKRYSEDDITRVKKAILGTRAKPGEKSFVQMIEDDDILGKILADADVSNFGRPDFAELSEKVYQEFVAVGKIAEDTPENKGKYLQFVKNYFSDHQWQTRAAYKLRATKEQENLRNI
jgi:predicted metal-dependent HD superfamily phosphohydrolase